MLRSGAEQGLANVAVLPQRLKATSISLEEALISPVFDRLLTR